jgi:DNA helicase-2/ATP-dependent DNA helicase PcrA
MPGYTAERRLAEILNEADADELAEEPLWPWLSRLADRLDLEAIATASRDQRDPLALGGFREADERFALTVADIAAGALRIGKVTLTTYHSAKGREWDVVIMPGLVDGIMPRRTWNRQLRRFADPAQLSQDRRAFYVGVTRAKNTVVLIYGQYWVTDWGTRNRLGTSRFVRDIIRSLGDQIPAG